MSRTMTVPADAPVSPGRDYYPCPHCGSRRTLWQPPEAGDGDSTPAYSCMDCVAYFILMGPNERS